MPDPWVQSMGWVWVAYLGGGHNTGFSIIHAPTRGIEGALRHLGALPTPLRDPPHHPEVGHRQKLC